MKRPTHLSVRGQEVLLVAPPLPDVSLPRLSQPPLPTPVELTTVPPVARPDQSPDSADHAEAKRLVHSISRSLLEVLQQRRSPAQLSMWMDESCHLLLVAWARQRAWLATRIASVRACRVDSTVVEGSVLMRDANRTFPVLLRLEQRYGRWHVTVFEVMVPPAAGARCA